MQQERRALGARSPGSWRGRRTELVVGVLVSAARVAVAEPGGTGGDAPSSESLPDEAGESRPAPGAIEVTVEGRRTLAPPAAARDPSAASTVISGEILKRPGASSADLLERVPGVQTQRAGADSELATASLRGATAAQTPVYLAGIRINDDVTGTADLSAVPLFMIERVEVFRGNAPFAADQLGVGGAVFFDPREPERNELGAGGSVGSFGYGAAWLYGAVRAPDGAALFGLREEGAENDYSFIDDRGTRFDSSDDVVRRRSNADYRARDLWAVGRTRLGRGVHVVSVLNGYEREQGATGLSLIPARRARARSERLLAGIAAESPCAGAAGSCRLELGTTMLLGRSVLTDPERELSAQGPLTASRGRRLEQSLTVSERFGNALRIGLSGRVAIEDLAIDSVGAAELRAERQAGRGAGHVTWSAADDLELHALGALEQHETTSSNRQRASSSSPVGRLGARYLALAGTAPSLELRANVGRAVRTPALGELYGVSAFVRGNDELGEERSLSFDFGLRSVFDVPDAPVRAYFDGFAFDREVSELIAYRRSSLGVIRPYNVGEARLYGAEAALGARAFDVIGLDGGLTVMQPLDVTPGRTITNDVLPFRSRLVGFGRAEVALERPFSPLDRASAGAAFFHRSSRFADPAGLIVIERHTSMDFDLAASLLDERLTLRFALDNAFDARAFDSVGLPLPGRALYAAAEVFIR